MKKEEIKGEPRRRENSSGVRPEGGTSMAQMWLKCGSSEAQVWLKGGKIVAERETRVAVV